MIPILFPADASSWSTNGLGRLAECTRCEVTEERNGIYEVEFDLPISARHYADIVEGMIISIIHDDTKTRQPFIIYRRTAPIDGIVTFYAHHISYLLSGIVVQPYTAGSAAEALALMPTKSLSTNPFTFATDKQTTATFSVNVPTGCRQLLGGTRGSILDTFGAGEYEFDGWTVHLWQNRGADRGVQIRYGKNLLDIEQDLDVSGIAGGVVGWWRGGDSGAEETVYTPVIYASGYSDGAPVFSLDLSGDFSEKPSVSQLTASVNDYITKQKPQEPIVNFKVDFVALWQTPEYASIAPLERVRLCDTVHVIYDALGVNATAKVIRTKYDVLTERYLEIELGQPKTNFAEMITAKTEELINAIPTKSMIEAAIDHATELITGGLGGHVVFTMNADGKPEEILIMDTDDVATAVNVIRMNKNGIGFSQNGYNGPFTSAWTIDNQLNMAAITVLNLTASMITAGILRDQTGTNYWNLETGDIYIEGDFVSRYGDYASKAGSDYIPYIPDSGTPTWTKNAGYFVRNLSNENAKPLFGVGVRANTAIEFLSTTNLVLEKYLIISDQSGNLATSGKYVRRRAAGTYIEWVGRTFDTASSSKNAYFDFSVGAIFTYYGTDTGSGRPTLRVGTTEVEVKDGSNTRYLRMSGSNFWINANDTTLYNSGIYLLYKDHQGTTHTVAWTSGSSRRYKHAIEDLQDGALDPRRLLSLRIAQYIYNDGVALQYPDMRGQLLPGFIAEEVAEIYPAAVIRDKDGRPESWDERRIIPGMLALIQQQEKKMEEYERRIERLERALEELLKK